MSHVVDLCTPPPANGPENASVQQPPPAKRRATGASTAPSNRKARVTESVEPASAAVVDSDDDVMEVEAPVRKVVSHESQAGGDEPTKENEDDEVSFIGRSGELALSDFPHSRENCVCAPWRAGKEQKHCQNCFCYVRCARLRLQGMAVSLQGVACEPSVAQGAAGCQGAPAA